MFGRGRIKSGDYVFVVLKDQNYNKLVIGRVQAVKGNIIQVRGTYIRPTGLIQRVESGFAMGRPTEVLQNPDPNNCIFMLIDRVETGNYNGEFDQGISKAIWINEKRFFVLDGWIRARTTLLEKMNSLYEKDLKDHLYAVVRSTNIL